jgi:hypothetical protein
MSVPGWNFVLQNHFVLDTELWKLPLYTNTICSGIWYIYLLIAILTMEYMLRQIVHSLLLAVNQYTRIANVTSWLLLSHLGQASTLSTWSQLLVLIISPWTHIHTASFYCLWSSSWFLLPHLGQIFTLSACTVYEVSSWFLLSHLGQIFTLPACTVYEVNSRFSLISSWTDIHTASSYCLWSQFLVLNYLT